MTLFAEIQKVMERTYCPSGSTGINLEECLIGRTRSRQLSCAITRGQKDLSPEAHTFLRYHKGNLHIAIYYSNRLIRALEIEDPRKMLSHRNIYALIAFIEEITHGVHAVLAFQAGQRNIESEQYACNLELQAKVDTYWMLLRFCKLLTGKKVTGEARSWIRSCVFDQDSFEYEDERIKKRYQFAQQKARAFIELSEKVSGEKRIKRIRAFREQSLLGKCRLLRGWRNEGK